MYPGDLVMAMPFHLNAHYANIYTHPAFLVSYGASTQSRQISSRSPGGTDGVQTGDGDIYTDGHKFIENPHLLCIKEWEKKKKFELLWDKR